MLLRLSTKDFIRIFDDADIDIFIHKDYFVSKAYSQNLYEMLNIIYDATTDIFSCLVSFQVQSLAKR